jgi:hypothetical protein
MARRYKFIWRPATGVTDLVYKSYSYRHNIVLRFERIDLNEALQNRQPQPKAARSIIPDLLQDPIVERRIHHRLACFQQPPFDFLVGCRRSRIVGIRTRQNVTVEDPEFFNVTHDETPVTQAGHGHLRQGRTQASQPSPEFRPLSGIQIPARIRPAAEDVQFDARHRDMVDQMIFTLLPA